MRANSESPQKTIACTPKKIVFKLKSNSVHPQGSRCTHLKKDRHKTLSHHTATILNQFSKPSRTSNYQSKSNSLTRSTNLKIYQADDMNLMDKLSEIENIRNYQACPRPQLKKKKMRRRQYLMSQNWQSYVQNDKISKNTYEKVKQKFKQKKIKQKYTIFTYHNKENLQKSQLEMLALEKPSEFCNFINGFPSHSINSQFEQREGSTKLSQFQGKLKNSETLMKIWSILDKKGHFERIDSKKLNKGFLSAVQVLDYVNKNGCADEKSKNMMRKAECTF